MLFTELDKIREEQIVQVLQQKAAAYGLEPDVLQQMLGDGVTMQTFVTDALKTLLAQASEANREEFRARRRKGVEIALKQGKAIGRPSMRSDERFIEVRDLYRTHEVSGKEAAAMLGVARGTFYRWLKEDEETESEE